jgi:hypothetical protein
VWMMLSQTMPISLRLRGSNAIHLPAISSCSALIVQLAALGMAEVVLPQASPAGLMENVPLSNARAATHLAHPASTGVMTLSQCNPVCGG